MKTYVVNLVKIEEYEVEAEDEWEAVGKACDLCEQDPHTWTSSIIDNWYIEE